MGNYNFILTDDNSVGLYNNIVNDIYHSKSGAYLEATEKFINPLNINNKKEEIKILDICYGIGYNTKAALIKANVEAVINVDALEYDPNLALLSPFIKDGIDDYNIKLLLLNSILNTKFNFDEIIELLNKNVNNHSNSFFDIKMLDFIIYLNKNGYKSNPSIYNLSFLHNIYYNYISYNNNNDVKLNKYNNSIIKYHFEDARKSIFSLKNVYDYVFLDAFSPQKDPTLWTIDFLNEVKQKMKESSIFVTYSKSTPFRSALLQLGFHVGKTIINDSDMGTVASLDKNNISIPLTSYDVELLNTRSGIPYRDESFTSSASEILKRREFEQSNSNLISHTAFLKKHSK